VDLDRVLFDHSAGWTASSSTVALAKVGFKVQSPSVGSWPNGSAQRTVCAQLSGFLLDGATRCQGSPNGSLGLVWHRAKRV
jgi:hypothetical protein